jgi:pilus assembly protein CpaB
MSTTLRFSLVGLLLLTALALGFVVFNLTRPNAPAQVVQGAPAPLQVAYIVAAHPLPAGTLARDEDFATKTAPSTNLPPGAITDTPEVRAGLRGSLIRNFIDAGSVVMALDVLRPRDRGFIASVLQPGMRAVSIGVDPISGVAGLIWPGDHVDVLLTQEMDKEALSRRAVTETVLRDVRVIAIDQQMVQGAPADSAAVGKLAQTVTVEVDPPQAEKLAVAAHLGKLSLAIRAAVDRTVDIVGRATFGADVSAALSHADRPAAGSVTVFEGDKHREVNFR